MTIGDDTSDKLEKQVLALPDFVTFCRLCVVSNQRPRIDFDEWGVCSACRYAYYKRYGIDWSHRRREFSNLLESFRSKGNGNYNVIVPSSGGKDSARAAHSLKVEWGMKPLTVTWAPFSYTDIGWQNFRMMVDAGFDNILGHPNGKVHRELSRLSFLLLGDPFVPFVYGQMAFPFHIASRFNIPLIFFGENGEAEYGGDVQTRDLPGMPFNKWAINYFKGAAVRDLVSGGKESGLIQSEIKDDSLALYELPPRDSLEQIGCEMRWFGFYNYWTPQENFYYAAEHTGFEANPEGRSEGTYSKYASLDDKLDGFHYYLAYIKFGIGRCTSDAAHEVRDGHITRDEAVALVKRFDGEFPARHFEEFLNYLDITEDQFWGVVNSWRRPEIWEQSSEGWRLRHTVYRDEDSVEPLIGEELKAWQESIAR